MKAAGQRFDAEVLVAGDGSRHGLPSSFSAPGGFARRPSIGIKLQRCTRATDGGSLPPLMSWTRSSAPQSRHTSRGGTWRMNPFAPVRRPTWLYRRP